jgi:hypothetical protein
MSKMICLVCEKGGGIAGRRRVEGRRGSEFDWDREGLHLKALLISNFCQPCEDGFTMPSLTGTNQI